MADVLSVLEVRTGPGDMPYVIAQVVWDSDPGDRPWVRVVASYPHDGVTERYVLRGSQEEHPGEGITRTYVDPQIPFGHQVTYVAQWASDPDVADWQDVDWDGASVPDAVATPVISGGRRQILTRPGEVGGHIAAPLVSEAFNRQSSQPGSLIQVQGRSTPVALWDVRTSATGSQEILCETPQDLRRLRLLLADGAPILVRTGRPVPGMLPREIHFIDGLSTSSWHNPPTTVADLEYTVVDDPEPGQLSSVGTFDDMQAAIDAVDDPDTIDDFDDIADYWVGLGLVTFANVAAYDWFSEANGA